MSSVSDQLSTLGTTLAKHLLAFCRRGALDRQQLVAPEETLNLLMLSVVLRNMQLLCKENDCQ